jgi:hypothetical protein
MHYVNRAKSVRSSHLPAYTFDSDSERVIRDPMAVLLGRSSLTTRSEPMGVDPYNCVGHRLTARRK